MEQPLDDRMPSLTDLSGAEIVRMQHSAELSDRSHLSLIELLHEGQQELQRLLNSVEGFCEDFDAYTANFRFLQGLRQDLSEIQFRIMQVGAVFQNLQGGEYLGELTLGALRLDEIVTGVASHFERSAYRRGIGLEFPHSEPVLVSASERHLQLVLNNIYSNAVKYSFKGSEERTRTVKTSVWREGDWGKVRISNYGVAVLPEEMHDLFEAGFRGLRAKQEDRTGVGLGLFTSQRLVLAMNGHIDVRSGPSSANPDSPYLTSVTIELRAAKAKP